MNTNTLNLDKAAVRTDSRSKRKVAVGRAIDMGITEPALPWATACVEHLTFGLSKTRGIAMVTVNPDFCATCAPDYPGWVNAELAPKDEAPAAPAKPVKAAPTKDAKQTKAEKDLNAKVAAIAVEKKVAAKRPARKAAKPVAEKNTIEEVTIDGGAPIKVTRVTMPKGAKAPFRVQDAQGIYVAETWTKAKSLATVGATACTITDANGAIVAKSDGSKIDTFVIETVAA